VDGELDRPGIEWPQALLERGELAGSGEPLWAAAELPAAIEWAERSLLAIVAVEVYGRVDLARGVFQRELRIEPGWSDGESWERYVARAAAEAREQLGFDLRAGRTAAAELYFLALVPEASLRRRP
jgi:hypothetical protein